MTIILPNVGPWRFLAFAGAVLALPGSTVAEVGVLAGLPNPAHRRRVAQALVEGGLCRLHGTSWGGAGGTGTVLHVHDHGKVSPTFELAGLDAAMGMGDLDRADAMLRKVPSYDAARRCLARRGRIPTGGTPSVDDVAPEFGTDASMRDVAFALSYPALLGQAWAVGGVTFDGGADLPVDPGEAFALAFRATALDGEATAAALLGHICTSWRLGPARARAMLAALGPTALAAWDLGDDLDPGFPMLVEVASGNLGELRGRAVPLETFEAGGRTVTVVRRRPGRVPRVRSTGNGTVPDMPAGTGAGHVVATPGLGPEASRRRAGERVPGMPVPPEDLLAAAAHLLSPAMSGAATSDGHADAVALRTLVGMGLAAAAPNGSHSATPALEGLAGALGRGRLSEVADSFRRALPDLDAVPHKLGARASGRVDPHDVGDLAQFSVSAFGHSRHWPVAKAWLAYATLLGAAWTDGRHVRAARGGSDLRAAVVAALARTAMGGAAPPARFLPELCRGAGLSPARVGEALRDAPATLPGCHLIQGRRLVQGGRGCPGDVVLTGLLPNLAFVRVPSTRFHVGGREIAYVVMDDVDHRLAGLSLAVTVEADAENPWGASAVVELLDKGCRVQCSAPFDPDDDAEVMRECSALREAMVPGSAAGDWEVRA